MQLRRLTGHWQIVAAVLHADLVLRPYQTSTPEKLSIFLSWLRRLFPLKGSCFQRAIALKLTAQAQLYIHETIEHERRLEAINPVFAFQLVHILTAFMS